CWPDREVAMAVLLAILFCGYFVLAGLDYGVALVAAGRSDLDRIAPFFLGNEVWLVAAIGLLFGAFPTAEGLLRGAYRGPGPLAVMGVVIVTAAFGLRVFTGSARGATGPGDLARIAPDGVALARISPGPGAPGGAAAESGAPGAVALAAAAPASGAPSTATNA